VDVIWIVYFKKWAIGKIVPPGFKQQQKIGEVTKCIEKMKSLKSFNDALPTP
jgi:hypothetical protein